MSFSRSGSLVLAAALHTLLLAQAHADTPPPIKPGLWEMTMESQTVDGKPLPDMNATMAAQMKNMPPQVRQQMEAQMKAHGVQMGSGGAVRMCLTAEQLAKNNWQKQEGHCDNTVVSRSGNTWNWKVRCTDPQAEGEGATTFTGSEAYSTNMKMTTMRDGAKHTMTMQSKAKRVSGDCGGLAPVGTNKK